MKALVLTVTLLVWSAAEEARWYRDRFLEGFVQVYGDVDDKEENCTVVLTQEVVPYPYVNTDNLVDLKALAELGYEVVDCNKTDEVRQHNPYR